jgi:hypothetical protein
VFPAVFKGLVTFIIKGLDSPSVLEDKTAHSIKMSETAYPASHPKRKAPEF